MAFHQRRLPHWHPNGRLLFLTWTLHGCIPTARFPPPGKPSSGEAFAYMDRYLDRQRAGPAYMSDPRIAAEVSRSLYCGAQLRHYDLHAFVVMPNHVHILVTPVVDPPKLVAGIKRSSAREANRVLNRTGHPFWQQEYYDHVPRGDEAAARVVRYIERNPVRAGLVIEPEDYRWSSASRWLAPAE